MCSPNVMERPDLTLIHTKSCVIYPTFVKQSVQNGQFLSNPAGSPPWPCRGYWAVKAVAAV
jgi:hypothetical protein